MNPFITQAKAIQAYIDRKSFSGALLIKLYDQTLVKVAAGFADRAQQVPNRIDTKFNLGSNSKMFTAIAIAQLAQKGLLDFNDPLGKYLKDYPDPDIRNVTIHQLLTHTGGTGDIFGPQFEANLNQLQNPKDYIRLYGHRKLEFAPGSQFTYSNYGFILLGAIIEAVTTQSYDDYIRAHIYKAANMISSDSYRIDSMANMAIGYMRSEKGLESNQAHIPVCGTPTGGSYSTIEDLSLFAAALQSHQLLNEKMTHLVTTGKVQTPDGQKYAYGFRDRTEKGIRWIGHSGGGPGVNTTLRIYPVLGYLIIILSNLDYPAADQLAQYVSCQS